MYDVSECGLSLFTNSFPFTMRTLHHPSNLGHLIPGSNPPNVLTLFTCNIYRLSYLHLIVFKIYLLARVAFKLISELCIEKDISPHHWKCAFHRKRYANAGHFVTTKIWNRLKAPKKSREAQPTNDGLLFSMSTINHYGAYLHLNWGVREAANRASRSVRNQKFPALRKQRKCSSMQTHFTANPPETGEMV